MSLEVMGTLNDFALDKKYLETGSEEAADDLVNKQKKKEVPEQQHWELTIDEKKAREDFEIVMNSRLDLLGKKWDLENVVLSQDVNDPSLSEAQKDSVKLAMTFANGNITVGEEESEKQNQNTNIETLNDTTA